MARVVIETLPADATACLRLGARATPDVCVS
jgi:hypothetical protein